MIIHYTTSYFAKVCFKLYDQGLLTNATACGQKGHKGRVVGGAEAAEHEFPWHCALLNSRGKVGPCLVVLVR